MTETLKQLWKLSGHELNENSPNWNDYFEPIGLILDGTFRKPDCWCTPVNSITFADNGGDAFWSLLDLGNGINEDSPVVMTVPGEDEAPNTIVGANLLDFLSLGCRLGYFTLEQLVYSREEYIEALDTQGYDSEMDQDQERLLSQLASRFKLKPWSNHAKRLSELSAKYSSAITLPESNGEKA